MKNIILFIILNGIYFIIYAQNNSDSLIQEYNHNTIFLKSKGFEKDGKTIRYGLFKKNLKKELVISPVALQEFKNSRTSFWVAIGFNVASTAITMAGIQRIGFNKETTYSGLVFNLVSIPFQIKAQNKLSRAVWLYNRDIMTRK
jgi:hypothetical protein